MADLEIRGDILSFHWAMIGLSNPFNQKYYKAAYITQDGYVDIGTETVTGVVSMLNAPASGGSTTIRVVDDNNTVGYQRGWGVIKAANGQFYPVGPRDGVRYLVRGERPPRFYWTNDFVTGRPVNAILASDWYKLLINLSDLRVSYGKGEIDIITPPERGMKIYADTYNFVVEMIKSFDGYGGYLNYVDSGETVKPYMLDAIQSELNAIP